MKVRVCFRKLDKGHELHIREILCVCLCVWGGGGGGNMKTCVAVYEEGLFD